MFSDWLSDRIIDTVVTQGRMASMPFELYSPEEHIGTYYEAHYQLMLKDKARMEAYRKAIAQVAQGKTVVEIGTGAHAPLARMCAEAGAKNIYAIEANPSAFESAKKLIAQQGLSEKITLIRGMSFDVDLPERCDLLVHELIGDFGANEGMVEAVADAKKRFLKSEHRVLPERCLAMAVAVEKPDFSNPLFYQLITAVKTLRNIFSKVPVATAYWNFPQSFCLSEPGIYEDCDFNEAVELQAKRRMELELKSPGRFYGLLVWPRIVFSDTAQLDCFKGTHWGAVCFNFSNKDVAVKKGEKIIVEVEQDLRGKTATRLCATLERNGESVALGTLEF